jgi:hypothetical protein
LLNCFGKSQSPSTDYSSWNGLQCRFTDLSVRGKNWCHQITCHRDRLSDEWRKAIGDMDISLFVSLLQITFAVREVRKAFPGDRLKTSRSRSNGEAANRPSEVFALTSFVLRLESANTLEWEISHAINLGGNLHWLAFNMQFPTETHITIAGKQVSFFHFEFGSPIDFWKFPQSCAQTNF